jgi:hypothetical protein
MSVKSFKFVSPGVFIHEIDNSFIPKTPEAIGPVVIGRSRRGLAMQPIKVEAYSDFVEMFGDTVPGFGGGDIWRDGNYQSPMYGTYAAKAFLKASVAPLTYIRLLGQETSVGSAAGGDAAAGWETLRTLPTGLGAAAANANNGGAYALWLFPSQSSTSAGPAGTEGRNLLGTASLGAIFYINQGVISLSGTIYGGLAPVTPGTSTQLITASNGVLYGGSSTSLLNMVINGTNQDAEIITFNFDDSSDNFIRKKFNTNPQLVSGSTFYSSDSSTSKVYWLGQTYEQELRDRGLTTDYIATMTALYGPNSATPADMRPQASVEGRSGWFIGQDMGTAGVYVPFNKQKLFRLVGRGHGEWLQQNVKVSIEKIRQSTTTTYDYGTFSVLLRSLSDTDSNVEIIERYDNLNLDPTSPNYIARVIGDKYTSWDTTDRRLKTYGEYDNQSKFVYVEMNPDVEAGATDPTLLPFGYFAPPRFRGLYDLSGTGSFNAQPLGTTSRGPGTPTQAFVTGGLALPWFPQSMANRVASSAGFLSGGYDVGLVNGSGSCTGSLVFPAVRLRNSASDGGLNDVTDAFFGMQTTREATSTTPDASIADFHRLLYGGYSGGGGTNTNPYATAGVEDWAYVFSLDDVELKDATSDGWYYASGSRARGSSYTAKSSSYNALLEKGIDKFTCPIYGGFDGFDIMKPDPVANRELATTSTEDNSYVYHTYKRAIDTVGDPEYINMNLLATPGLTNAALTTHQIRVCEERADSMALIDLPDVYIPAAEGYYSSKSSRIGTTPTNAGTALRDRRIDSSYGATFYPWVQTRDENTGAMLWVPPSVAMMGVLASSERASAIWFAPAGFNRGGLSEGAAGIPITGITQRLTSKDRDTLYENNINPIASFPSSGIVVFGQKTLQERQSALDRINVRRLVIYLKKQISVLSTQILFEQNVQATWNRFISLVEPFLANVKTQYGITDYRLILDESTTTPDLIDQNILYAKIMIKPARAIEYIAIDFVIMSTGASFDD